MNIKPLGDRVVVKRLEAEEKTSGGILLPQTAQEKPQQCEVLAVGPGARDDNGKYIPMDVKPGDTVLISKWGGTEIKMDGQELLILKESDILGVVEAKSSKKKRLN